MLVDATELPEGMSIQTDVCIVGAGVAGMTLALEFIGRPFQVCLLESGGLEPVSDTQALASGESVGQPYFPLDDARPRCFGGSAYNWLCPIGEGRLGIQARPLDPIDFEERSWVPHSGWPFKRADLDPFYARAQSICGLGPCFYGPEDWADAERRPCLPFVGSDIQTVMFQLSGKEVFLDRHRAEIGKAQNVTSYLNATVLEVETNASGQAVRRLRVATTDQKRLWASAKIYILALGGIETPRFLLLSRQHHRDGLGNGNDLVGRFFMEHPHLMSGTYLTAPFDVPRATGLYLLHATDKGKAYARLALTDEAIRRERLLNWSVAITHKFWPLTVRTGLRKISSLCRMIGASLRKRDISECRRQARTLAPFLMNEMTPAIARSIGGLLRRRLVQKLMPSRRGAAFILQHMCEQAPNPSSRVTLSDSRDRFGQQRVRLNWQLSEIDIETMRRSQEILDRELQAAGLGRVEIEMKNADLPAGLHGGWHHMGTTRMHSDPKCGVVNEHCRIHECANLYVAGPSTFPTSGYANPTLTIVALAVRLADHVKYRLGSA